MPRLYDPSNVQTPEGARSCAPMFAASERRAIASRASIRQTPPEYVTVICEIDYLLDFFGGTLAPFSRASERPIAMACSRLLTFPPFPDFSFPCFNLCMARSTVSDAFLPYLRLPDFFLGIFTLLSECSLLRTRGRPVLEFSLVARARGD